MRFSRHFSKRFSSSSRDYLSNGNFFDCLRPRVGRTTGPHERPLFPDAGPEHVGLR